MRFFLSLKFALRGIGFALRERNFKIQIACAVLVVIAGWYFHISNSEWLAIAICVGSVLSTEMFNTAIEKLADFIHPQQNKKIGQLKDVAAGAVLVFAIVSLIVAGIIFIPKFF